MEDVGLKKVDTTYLLFFVLWVFLEVCFNSVFCKSFTYEDVEQSIFCLPVVNIVMTDRQKKSLSVL